MVGKTNIFSFCCTHSHITCFSNIEVVFVPDNYNSVVLCSIFFHYPV